ncbi:MAG: DUF3494 domain-containing protein [Actinobacteria bacterium]|nr:DUF3494 domain-containing protein [Actinomycetota bacterium]
MKRILTTRTGRITAFLLVVVLGAPVVISLNRSSAAWPTIRQGSTTSFGVLASSTVTNTGPTSISGTAGGYVGLYPGTSFTGSASVTRSGDHITDGTAQLAQTDLVTAYNDLGVPTPTVIGPADLVGKVILPGTYSTASGTFANSGNVTLDALGDPSAVFIFQAASTVITSTSSTMTLSGGAQACNVYWRVGSSATIGVSSTFVGHVYAMDSVTATTNATIYGQLLARNAAVTLDTNTIINNNCDAPVTTTNAQTTTTSPATSTLTSTTTVAGPTSTVVGVSITSTTAVPRTTTTIRRVTTTTREVQATTTTVRAGESSTTVPRSNSTLPTTR